MFKIVCLRKDVLYMLNQEWEPKVPSDEIIRDQFLWFYSTNAHSVFKFRENGRKKERSQIQ